MRAWPRPTPTSKPVGYPERLRSMRNLSPTFIEKPRSSEPGKLNAPSDEDPSHCALRPQLYEGAPGNPAGFRQTVAALAPESAPPFLRSEEHTSELQSHHDLVC